MPLSPAPYELEQPRKSPSLRSVGRRALWFAGLMVGSAYSLSKQSAEFVQQASQAYIDHEYGDDEKKD